MIVDEDIYLEHFGKKGMQWGVRRKANLKSGKEKYKEFGKGDKKKTAAKYAATAYVGYKGAKFVGRRLASVGNRLLKRTLLNGLKNEAAVNALFDNLGDLQTRDIFG